MSNNKVYKYFNFNRNEDGIIYSLDALSHSYVYAAPPSLFNDPFDCAVQAELDLTPLVLRNYYQSREMPKEEIEARLAYYFDEGDHLTKAGYAEQESFKKQISSMNQVLGVTCFSKQPYNPLMWAHYANNHNGYCLEFELGAPFETKRIDDGVGLHIYGDVDYATNGKLPKVSLSDFLHGTVKTLDLILQKGRRWIYEEESRLIVTVETENDRKINYHPDLLKGIYYGINIQPELKTQLEELVNKHYSHVDRYDMKVSDQYYWMDKTPL